MEKTKTHKYVKYVAESDFLKENYEIGNDKYCWKG